MAHRTTTSLRLPTHLLFICSFMLSTFVGCGEEEAVGCFDERDCGANQRCHQPKFGTQGTCQPCEPNETPYDGRDNDCDPATRDSDLDGDGDNWTRAPPPSGTDCDDQDSTVRPGLPEVCADQKDNDCDGKVDEKDCADRESPLVVIRTPTEGQLILGPIVGSVEVADDVGLVELVVSMDGVALPPVNLSEALARTVAFEFSGTSLQDGRRMIQATVTDIAGKTASDSVFVDIDLHSPPTISITRPGQGGTYGGMMNLEATITDPSGVASVEVLVDGVLVATTTSAQTSVQLQQAIDTRTLADGPHRVRVVALEGRPSNPGTSATEVNFNIDNTPPTLNVTSPLPGSVLMGTVPLTAEALDATGADIAVPLAGIPPGPSPLTQSWDTTTQSNGATFLDFIATDHVEIDGVAGGNSITTRVQVEVQNLNPVTPGFRILSPAPNAEVWGRTEIAYEYVGPSNDPPVGPRRLRVDGEIIGYSIEPTGKYIDMTPYAGRSVVLEVVGTGRMSNREITGSVQVNVLSVPEFTAPTMFTTDHSDLEVMDVDQDGALDILTISDFLGGIQVLRGEVVGRRWQVAEAVLVQRPSQQRMARARIGGAPAIVSLSGGTGLCSYRWNAGIQPSIQCQTAPGTPNDPPYWDVSAGDLNGDGDDDVVLFSDVIAPPSGIRTARAFLWNGTDFTPGPELSEVGAEVQLADVDGDLDLDVVAASRDRATLKVFRNQGDATFLPSLDTIPPDPIFQLAVGDVSGDGLPDVVIDQGPPLGRGWMLFAGVPAAPGTFVQGGLNPYNTSRHEAIDLSAIDLDLDGYAEVVAVVAGLGSGLELWRGGALGATFVNTRSLFLSNTFQYQTQALFFDLNADGILDAAGSRPNSDEVSIAYGEADLSFYAASVQGLGGSQCRGMTVGPVRGSSPDVVLGVGSMIGIFAVGANGLRNPAWLPYSSVVSGVALGDARGDPGLDLLVTGGPQPALHTNLGGGTFQVEAVGPGTNDSSDEPVIGDLTEDGLQDLGFKGRPASGPSSFSIIDGASLAEAASFPMPYMTAGVMLREVDRGGSDGLDVIGLDRSTQDLFVAQKIGGSWMTTQVPVSGVFPALLEARAADFDGDGYSDFLACSGDRVVAILNDPVALFSSGTDLGVQFGAGQCWQPTLIDVDADGDDDLVNLGGTLAVSRRDASGGFGPITYLSSLGSANGQTVVRDLNGDGTLDLANYVGCAVHISQQRPL